MDSDLLVCANIDELFSFELLVALMRGHSDASFGEIRAAESYFHPGTPKLRGGINGGVVGFVLSKATLQDMGLALKDPTHLVACYCCLLVALVICDRDLDASDE